MNFVDLERVAAPNFHWALLLAPELRAIRVSDQQYWLRQGISAHNDSPFDTEIAKVQEST